MKMNGGTVRERPTKEGKRKKRQNEISEECTRWSPSRATWAVQYNTLCADQVDLHGRAIGCINAL